MLVILEISGFWQEDHKIKTYVGSAKLLAVVVN